MGWVQINDVLDQFQSYSLNPSSVSYNIFYCKNTV